MKIGKRTIAKETILYLVFWVVLTAILVNHLIKNLDFLTWVILVIPFGALSVIPLGVAYRYSGGRCPGCGKYFGGNYIESVRMEGMLRSRFSRYEATFHCSDCDEEWRRPVPGGLLRI